jgi:hypothetical protein
MFRNTIRFYGKEFLAPRPTPKLEDRTLSSVRDCLFNTFATTLHIGCRSSIRNLRTCHAVVAGTHLPWLDNCEQNLHTHATVLGLETLIFQEHQNIFLSPSFYNDVCRHIKEVPLMHQTYVMFMF